MTEATRTALTRLTSTPNDYARELSYHAVDRAVVNECGDTALHRLLAAHTGIAQLDAFLRHHFGGTVSRTRASREIIPSLNHTNVHGVNALHIAVFRNGYQVKEIVNRLLQVDPSLARAPIYGTSMYPLHIALAYSLTIEMPVIDMLLETYAEATTIRNADGASALELLTANVQRFRWAQSTAPALEFSEQQDYTYMTIISPFQYMRIGMMILHAMNNTKNRLFSWHFVAAEAPVLLLRILLQEQKRCLPGFWTRDDRGRYPLHCATSRVAAELLLLHAGSTTNVPDDTGRWPLHQMPRSLALAVDAPEALAAVDPKTGLFPYQLAASSSDVDTIFQLLRMNPSVIGRR